MDISITVTDQQIADLLVGAFEGGSNYWIENIKTIGRPESKKIGNDEYPSYITCALAANCHVDIQPNEHAGVPIKFLHRDSIRIGLEAMATQCPQHFGNFLSGDYDSITSDVFLQCCIFGELVFG